MGTDRSSLSCRTLLFLFVLLGTPLAARSGTLEDSAKELAHRIVAALPSREGVSVDVRNLSSLSSAEVGQVEQTLVTELQTRGLHTSANGSSAIRVQVILSENLKTLLWSAEISQGDVSHVVLVTVSRVAHDQTLSNAMPVVLRSEKFWEGPERVLDAETVFLPGGMAPLVLLLPDGLAIHDASGGPITKVEIQSGQTAAREPRGYMTIESKTVFVVLPPRACTVALDTHTLTECHATDVAGVPVTLKEGNDFVMVQMECPGADHLVLESGLGDYTQPDSLRVFRSYFGDVAVSNALDFPGPIIAFHVAVPDTPRVIVRNLKTGNYEAYRLSFSCMQ